MLWVVVRKDRFVKSGCVHDIREFPSASMFHALQMFVSPEIIEQTTVRKDNPWRDCDTIGCE